MKLFRLVNKVKWFQVLEYIMNNSFEYQSFVFKLLNAKTALFQTTQFRCLINSLVLFDP